MPASAASGHGSPGPETAVRLIPWPEPSAIIRAMKNAATPASDIWNSEICPVYPVSTTSESMTMTNTSDVWIAPANTVRMPLFSNT